MLQFAGIDVSPLPDNLRVLADRWWDEHAGDLLEYPGFFTDGLDFLPFPYPSEDLRVRLNTLVWPTGASRWGSFHTLVGGVQKNAIEAAVGTNAPVARTLFISDDVAGTSITPQMFLREFRPVFVQGAVNEQIWLMSLVDQRFYWWQKALGEIALTQGDSWNTLIGRFFTALGVSPALAAVNGSYGVPSFARWANMKAVPMPIVIDAAVATVGQKVVVNLAGAVQTVLPITAVTNDSNQYTIYQPQLGFGGRRSAADIAGLIPSSVVVGYWSVGKVGTSGYTITLGNFVNSTGVSLSAPGTGYSPGDVLTIPNGSPNIKITVNTVGGSGQVGSFTVTQQGTYNSTTPNPAPATGGTGAGATFLITFIPATLAGYGSITGVPGAAAWFQGDAKAGTDMSYAVQTAIDWYSWRLSLTDAIFRSVQPWVPTGLESRVEWEYRPGEKATDVGGEDRNPANRKMPGERVITRVVPAISADANGYGNHAPRGIGFSGEITARYNKGLDSNGFVIGYSWKRQKLDPTNGLLVDPEATTSGTNAYSFVEDPTLQPGTLGWFEPSPDGVGWIIEHCCGGGSGSVGSGSSGSSGSSGTSGTSGSSGSSGVSGSSGSVSGSQSGSQSGSVSGSGSLSGSLSGSMSGSMSGSGSGCCDPTQISVTVLSDVNVACVSGRIVVTKTFVTICLPPGSKVCPPSGSMG